MILLPYIVPGLHIELQLHSTPWRIVGYVFYNLADGLIVSV